MIFLLLFYCSRSLHGDPELKFSEYIQLNKKNQKGTTKSEKNRLIHRSVQTEAGAYVCSCRVTWTAAYLIMLYVFQ